MSLHCLQIANERDGTIPCRSAASDIFQHVWLRPDRINAWRPIADPAKVDAGEVSGDPLRLRYGVGARRSLHHFWLEDIKSITAGKNMPTEVRLAGTLGEERFRIELLVHDPLSARHIKPIGRRHIFGAIEVHEFESSLPIDILQPLSDLGLNTGVLREAHKNRPSIDIQHSDRRTDLVSFGVCIESTALAAQETIWW